MNREIKPKPKTRQVKAWCEVSNHHHLQKETIGQYEIYDKKKNGSENRWRIDHSTKLVPCLITFPVPKKEL